MRVFRPAIADLILTKMMRIDPQDREDLRFLLHQPDFEAAQLLSALERARIPPIAEIEHAFVENKQWLLGVLEEDK